MNSVVSLYAFAFGFAFVAGCGALLAFFIKKRVTWDRLGTLGTCVAFAIGALYLIQTGQFVSPMALLVFSLVCCLGIIAMGFHARRVLRNLSRTKKSAWCDTCPLLEMGEDPNDETISHDGPILKTSIHFRSIIFGTIISALSIAASYYGILTLWSTR